MKTIIIAVVILVAGLASMPVEARVRTYENEAASNVKISPETFRKVDKHVKKCYPGFNSDRRWLASSVGFVKFGTYRGKSLNIFIAWDGMIYATSSSTLLDESPLIGDATKMH